MTPLSSKKIVKITKYGFLLALALILSYIEIIVPPFFPIPGMKLGITNIVVLYALYKISAKAAILINFIRILLMLLIFGNSMSFIFSLFGCLLSFVVMLILKEVIKLKLISVSIAGGVFHNIGQILAAIIIFKNPHLFWYFCVLWISGIISGIIIGILSFEIFKRVK